LHYSSNGLPFDGGRSAEEWTLTIGPVILRLGNFRWRRRALPCHDVHHVLTGYECTPTGEMEIAAWEFAAGPFPNLLATLFCLPLVGIGALAIPRRSFAAFVRGRRSQTLYALPLSSDLAGLQLGTLRSRLLPPSQPLATLPDVGRYLLLVTSSLVLLTAPVAALVAVVK
jgi:hypothetical protein